MSIGAGAYAPRWHAPPPRPLPFAMVARACARACGFGIGPAPGGAPQEGTNGNEDVTAEAHARGAHAAQAAAARAARQSGQGALDERGLGALGQDPRDLPPV